MLLHLNGAEQLRSQWWLVVGVLPCQAASAWARPQAGQDRVDGLAARFHLLPPLDLLDHILSSQLSRARFALPLSMSFICTFNVAFVISIFIAQHYV
jgi:hypothetical protein